MKNPIIILLFLLKMPFGFGQINLASSLTACYALNGNGNEPINNLTATLSAVTPTVDRFGNAGSAYHFTGSPSSYIKLPNSPLLKPNTISLSFWARLDYLANVSMAFAQNSCPSYFEGYNMGMSTAGGGIYRFGGSKCSSSCTAVGQLVLSGTLSAVAQTWYHLGFYFGPDSMKLYVNGNLDGAMAAPNALTYNPNLNVYLGGTNSNPNFPFVGSIDNVRFYNRKLSSAEFNQLYLQDPGCLSVPPVASFSFSPQVVCSGQTISLADQSTNIPTAWSWQMNGALPPVSTSSNPVISYANPGNYVVSLVSSNASGSSNSFTSSITVLPLPTVSITGNKLICKGDGLTLTAIGAATYTWNNLQTSASITVVPVLATIYTVTGKDVNGCANTATVSLAVSPCASLKKETNEGYLTVFPNPTSGKFTIESSQSSKSEIIIYNVLGEVVLTTKSVDTHAIIDLSDKPNGIYLMELRSGETLLTKKIIKENK